MMELLAPAGSIEIAYSAFNSGADAVYFAGKSFGARATAPNFTNEEIVEITKFAHQRDKKVYVTVNTICFEDEIEECLEFLDFLYLNDIDGVIVQDLGLSKIISERYPGLELHGSTQMNIHTKEDAEVLKKLGYKRVVISREAPIEVVKEIKATGIEVEVFIHGALCVAYSGNCYISSIIGKRSGNRGRCAQPCRLEYKLNKNGETIDIGALLSPKELCTIEYINELKEAKVDSLKIEGRLKRQEYVSLVVSSYKRAILNHDFDLNKEIKKLKIAYNRGFTKGFIFHENNNYLVNKSYQNHQGLLIGSVVSTYKDKVNIKLTDSLKFGDSIRIVGKKTDGVTINQMYVNNTLVKCAKVGDIVTIKVHEDGLGGAKVYLTSSIDAINEASNLKDNYKVDITGKFFKDGSSVCLALTDGVNEVSVKKEVKFDPNINIEGRIKEQLSKTGATIFNLTSLDVASFNPVMSVKELNELRREALDKLAEKRSRKYINREIKKEKRAKLKIEETSDLLIKVKTKEQLEAALKFNAKVFIEDYKLFKEYEDKGVMYATPRVFNKYYLGSSLTESLSNMNNSYSSVYLNVNNSYAMERLFELGAKCVGVSIEASLGELSDMVNGFIKRLGAKPNLFIMAYGYYELMITKYCMVQKANNIENKNCNQCILNKYELVDRKDYHFPITKGEGCYTKILNSKRVHLLPKLNEIKDLGINNILLDFSIETGEETFVIIDMYAKALNGDLDQKHLGDVTYGHFNEGVY